MLEDLTHNDVKEYITSHFEDDPNVSLLHSSHPEDVEHLIDKMVEKASGVFLWVFLVVFALLVGTKPGDNITDLRQRLAALEPDLQGLYSRMFDNLNPLYFHQAAQYFRLLDVAMENTPALLFSFAMEEDPDFALKIPIRPLPTDEIQLRVEATRRRINNACKGLIEFGRTKHDADETYTSTIQYLHRTAREYLGAPDVQSKLIEAVGESFDPNLELCKASLALYKTSNKEGTAMSLPNDNSLTRYKNPLYRCMTYAAGIHLDHASEMIMVLDDLEQSQKLLSPRFDPISNEQRLCRMCNQKYGPSFLSLAVIYGVIEYVKARVPPGCLVDRLDGRPVFKPLPKFRLGKPKTW
jgi:hypothetical protein